MSKTAAKTMPDQPGRRSISHEKLAGVLFYSGLIISALVGFLHFFAPYAFQWYSFIPDAPKEIFAAIDYVNFFLSLLLFGISVILIFQKKRIFAGSLDAMAFYLFLSFTWLCRIVVTLAVPWPSSLQKWLLMAFSVEFLLTLFPAVHMLRIKQSDIDIL